MVCPECGREIPEGHLYCDTCGTEVRIVPDFEPEVENSITESLSSVAESLTEKKEDEDKDTGGGREKQKNLFVLSLGCLFVLFLIIMVGYLSVNAYFHSADYQYKTAMEELAAGNYEEALAGLQGALDAGGDYEEIEMQVIGCYEKLGDTPSYLESLYELIRHEDVSRERMIEGYELIIAHYEQEKQYEQINTLLQDCPESSLQEKYAKYMANMPEFNYVEGAYNEVVPLKILSNTNGHIYYTMNGKNPDRYSEEYTSPIFLESGNYEITAVFVNEYGIQSPYAKAVYQIDVSMPFAPEVDAYSGEFYTPQMLHAEAEEGCQIYYTTDGSKPDGLSNVYTGFLPMPLGDSSFRFAAIDENGVSSEVTVRNYHLELITDYTWEDAQSVVLRYMLDTGHIVSLDGTISEEDPRKMVYMYACCVNIADKGDFYIFSEYIESADGNRVKTGSYYAVGIYNLPLYGTQYDARTSNFALNTGLLRQGAQDATESLEEESQTLAQETGAEQTE